MTDPRKNKPAELTEDQLDQVSSGTHPDSSAIPMDDELDAVADGGRCICSFGGGGKASENEKTCACVMGGGGEYSNGDVRCVCIVGGDGNW